MAHSEDERSLVTMHSCCAVDVGCPRRRISTHTKRRVRTQHIYHQINRPVGCVHLFCHPRVHEKKKNRHPTYFFQGFSWLVIFETGRYCFDMFGGKKVKTGRDGKIMKIIVAWMGRDGMVGVNFLDGTGRYTTMTFLFHDGTGR